MHPCEWKPACGDDATELWDRKTDVDDAHMLTKQKRFCQDHGVDGRLRRALPGPEPETIRASYDIYRIED